MYFAGIHDGSLGVVGGGGAAAGGGGGGGGSSSESVLPTGLLLFNLTFLMALISNPPEELDVATGVFFGSAGGGGFSTGFGLPEIGMGRRVNGK